MRPAILSSPLLGIAGVESLIAPPELCTMSRLSTSGCSKPLQQRTASKRDRDESGPEEHAAQLPEVARSKSRNEVLGLALPVLSAKQCVHDLPHRVLRFHHWIALHCGTVKVEATRRSRRSSSERPILSMSASWYWFNCADGRSFSITEPPFGAA
jgi:hypothetical protein